MTSKEKKIRKYLRSIRAKILPIGRQDNCVNMNLEQAAFLPKGSRIVQFVSGDYGLLLNTEVYSMEIALYKHNPSQKDESKTYTIKSVGGEIFDYGESNIEPVVDSILVVRQYPRS